MFVSGQVVDESSSVMNRSGGSPVERPSAVSPCSSDSEDLLTDEQSGHRDVCVNNDGSSWIKEEGTVNDDDDVDIEFYPRRNRVDSASFNSVVMLDHNYFRIPTPGGRMAAVTACDDSVVIKNEPLDFKYEDAVSGMFQSEFDSMYIQPKHHGSPEVKTETADDLYSAAVSSLDEFEMSDSESEDFYDSENSDDFDTLDDEHMSEIESCPDADEPARKKIRVTFGVDQESEESTTVGSVVIDANILEDPKLHMTPIVELEDVLQIILAWQQNAGETDDIM